MVFPTPQHPHGGHSLERDWEGARITKMAAQESISLSTLLSHQKAPLPSLPLAPSTVRTRPNRGHQSDEHSAEQCVGGHTFMGRGKGSGRQYQPSPQCPQPTLFSLPPKSHHPTRYKNKGLNHSKFFNFYKTNRVEQGRGAEAGSRRARAGYASASTWDWLPAMLLCPSFISASEWSPAATSFALLSSSASLSNMLA